MSEATQRFITELSNRIDAGKAAGMNATFQFAIADEDGAQVHATIVNGDVQVADGAAAKPDVTLTATADDWLALLAGDLGGAMAYLTGKLKIHGDVTLAMKLQSVFRFA